MKFYVEITLLPSIETPINFLWEKVYQQIHLALVENQDSHGKVSIGVSFPEYDCKQFQLGNKLRLFSFSQEELEHLNIRKWLFRLRDYIHITDIRYVPENINGRVFFKRIQMKSSNSRMARRKAKREGISYEEALVFLNKRFEKTSKLPFIHMKSLSSENRYRLIIGCEKTDYISDSEEFSTYGLSSNCSVPVF